MSENEENVVFENYLKKIRTDCTLEKKKHFNAADRKERTFRRINLAVIGLSVLSATAIIAEINFNSEVIPKIIEGCFSAITIALAFYLMMRNDQMHTEKHKLIANEFIDLANKCDYELARIKTCSDPDAKIKEFQASYKGLIDKAILLNTTKSDYEKARKGIESGEESYTKKDLAIGEIVDE
jgi:hypothetical protein